MTYYDFEYLVIVFSLITLFVCSLSRRTVPFVAGYKKYFVVDLGMSMAMKGIACVMILMSHWGQRRFGTDLPWGISRIIWGYGANIALSWFMFFSGYGLSLKHWNKDEQLMPIWLKRLKKVYLPLFVSCVFCSLCYLLFPSIYDLVESKELWISKDIYYLHHPTQENLLTFLPHLFGWRDWYVLCIICFYSMFYYSIFLGRKTGLKQTYCLFILMTIYYVWAFWFYGRDEAHFFRFCWIFLVGHVIGARIFNKTILLLLLLFGLTALLEGKSMCIAFLTATFLLCAFSYLNRYFEVKGNAMLLLGSISYFFYLLHTRICYTLAVYLHINSIILWLLLTLSCSYLVWTGFNKIFKL